MFSARLHQNVADTTKRERELKEIVSKFNRVADLSTSREGECEALRALADVYALKHLQYNRAMVAVNADFRDGVMKMHRQLQRTRNMLKQCTAGNAKFQRTVQEMEEEHAKLDQQLEAAQSNFVHEQMKSIKTQNQLATAEAKLQNTSDSVDELESLLNEFRSANFVGRASKAVQVRKFIDANKDRLRGGAKWSPKKRKSKPKKPKPKKPKKRSSQRGRKGSSKRRRR